MEEMVSGHEHARSSAERVKKLGRRHDHPWHAATRQNMDLGYFTAYEQKGGSDCGVQEPTRVYIRRAIRAGATRHSSCAWIAAVASNPAHNLCTQCRGPAWRGRPPSRRQPAAVQRNRRAVPPPQTTRLQGSRRSRRRGVPRQQRQPAPRNATSARAPPMPNAICSTLEALACKTDAICDTSAIPVCNPNAICNTSANLALNPNGVCNAFANPAVNPDAICYTLESPGDKSDVFLWV